MKEIKFIVKVILFFVILLFISVVITLLLHLGLVYLFSKETTLNETFKNYYNSILIGILAGALVDFIYRSKVFENKK